MSELAAQVIRPQPSRLGAVGGQSTQGCDTDDRSGTSGHNHGQAEQCDRPPANQHPDLDSDSSDDEFLGIDSDDLRSYTAAGASVSVSSTARLLPSPIALFADQDAAHRLQKAKKLMGAEGPGRGGHHASR